jgi:hypothetical protein
MTELPYVNIEKQANGNIKLSLSASGKKKVKEAIADGTNIEADDFFIELLAHNLANGWTWIRPEDVGALTSAPILSDDVKRDDNGKLVSVVNVWWYTDYQLYSPVAEMLDGPVEFQLGE